MIIDWHNYGYTLMALALGKDHTFVKIAKRYEIYYVCIINSVNSINFNSRDQHKHEIPLFCILSHTLCKTIKMFWVHYNYNNIPLLNSMRILTVQSMQNFKFLKSTSVPLTWKLCTRSCSHKANLYLGTLIAGLKD